MAITAPTKLSDFSGYLNPEMAAPIFEKAAELSIVQRLGQQVQLSPNGTAVPVVTGELTAEWVAEATAKPASKGSQTLKTITPQKISVIAVASSEVVRANPGNYIQMVRNQVAKSFAVAFDAAALHGTNSPFGQYLDQTTKAVELGSNTATDGGVWQDLNSALRLLVEDGRELNGWAFDYVAEPTLNGSVDANGRPLFVDSPLVDTAPGALRGGRVMGRPAFMGKGVGTTDDETVVGYGGDWLQCAWGTVGGITFDVDDRSAVTIDGSLVSMFERNLVAIRAEAEFGFLCNDVSAFCRLTNLIGS